MIWLRYWKPLAALGILVAAFVGLKYLEHKAYKAGVASCEAKSAAAIAKQTTENAEQLKKARETFNAKLAQKDSSIAGLARRLHDYEVRGRVPPTPGGTEAPSGVDRSDEEIRRAAEEVYAAAERDALRLNLCREAWPK